MSSRQEDMLSAIAEGDIINDEPRCRREQFLKAIANGDGTTNLPEPNCREEKLLKVIAEKGIGGGGGITPEGTLEINQNGTHDVTNYASANVNVPVPIELIYATFVSDLAGSLNGLWKLLYGTRDFGIFVEFDKANFENITEGRLIGSDMYHDVYGVLTPTPCRLIMYSNGVKNVGTAQYIFGVDLSNFDKPLYVIQFVECDANWQGLGLDQILLYYNPSSNTVTHFPTDDPSSIDGYIMYKLEDINLQDKEVTENGEYYHDAGYTGLGKLTVNVPSEEPTLVTKEITENGTYNASDESADGYSSITVKVASSGGSGEDMMQTRVNTTNSASYLFYGYTGDNVDYITNLDLSNVTDLMGMFTGCSKLTTIPLIDTSNVKKMSNMFQTCTHLTTIPLLNTSNVTEMNSMFYYCNALTNIPQLDTSNVTTMESMFNQCPALTEIPLLNTSNVTKMNSMFVYCSALTTIPQLDTSNAINMGNMFQSCTGLISVPALDTSKATNMANMFSGCSNLTTVGGLDLISITSSNKVSAMVGYCPALTNLTLKNIKVQLQIGSGTSSGHLLTIDSLVNTIKELWNRTGSTSYRLTMGTANVAKLADVYVKLVTPTAEQIAADPYIESKLPCEVCESTDEGAMLITDYIIQKNWTYA